MATNGHAHSSELNHIRKDIDSLKSNILALTQSLHEDVRSEATQKIEQLGKTSYQAVNALEDHVREKPAQSLLAAFCAGIVLSALAKRL